MELLERLYERFNARDMEAVLATMHPDVIWPNGMEGGMSLDATAFATTGGGRGP
jgi:hypothetical protein